MDAQHLHTPRRRSPPFWGTILPVDHPFWNEHRPGDRWNCKCRLRNTDKEATAVPTGTKNDLPNSGLENNPGKDGKIFSGKHPYMPQSCGACPFGHGKLWALAAGKNKGKNKGKNCGNCPAMKSCVQNAKGNQNTTGKQWLKDTISAVTTNGFACKQAITLCNMPKELVNFANNNNIKLSAGGIRISDTQIRHALRDVKVNAGRALTEIEIENMDAIIPKSSIFYDSSKENFVFVSGNNLRTIKYIVQPEYATKMNEKKEIGNHFITGGVIPLTNTNDRNLIEIKSQ